jgi:hypothetical protein
MGQRSGFASQRRRQPLIRRRSPGNASVGRGEQSQASAKGALEAGSQAAPVTDFKCCASKLNAPPPPEVTLC